MASSVASRQRYMAARMGFVEAMHDPQIPQAAREAGEAMITMHEAMLDYIAAMLGHHEQDIAQIREDVAELRKMMERK